MQRATKLFNSLIVGDFNTPEIDWGTPRCWGSEHVLCSELLEQSLFWGLNQHIRYPTRAVPGQKESILDLVFSHEEDDVVNVNYSEPIGKSDHTTLRFEWTKSYRVLHPSLPQRNIWRADLDGMLSAATGIDWNLASELELEHMWSCFEDNIHRLVSRYVPISRKISIMSRSTLA